MKFYSPFFTGQNKNNKKIFRGGDRKTGMDRQT